MIRPIDIRLNAAHPELPLAEAVTFTGSPSTVLIRGVPPNCGRWAITAVFVAASFPDSSTTTRAAVQSANGVWVATLPATATSGRTANGIRIMADGIDESGEAVTGYILGVADFAVASLDVTPAPEPGETSYQMLYFDEVPSVLHKGDVAKIDGVLKFYNGTAWEPFAAPVTLDDAVTPNSSNGVKSSGIWSAIWGALSALPTGFASLYDWCVSQLAGKQSTLSAQQLANIAAVSDALSFDATHSYAAGDPVVYNGTLYTFTSAHTGPWTGSDVSAVDIIARLAGKLDKSGGTVTGDILLGNSNVALSATGEVVVDFGAVGEGRLVFPLVAGKTTVLAHILNIAPKFSSAYTYAQNALCVYNNVLYRCTTAVTTAGAWTGLANWTSASIEDVLAALRTGKADKPATFTEGNLAEFDANGNPTNSLIPAANVATKGEIRYTLPETVISITSALSEVVSGETVYYGEATLADRTANIVGISVALDELRITFPAATNGKVRDFGLLVAVGLGEGTALAAPALVPVAPTGETITMMNAEGEMPTLADGTTTASGVTVLYFTEIGIGTFLVKGEQIQGVA